MDADRAAWLRQLADAARAASERLRSYDDPLLHRALIDDLDAFRARIVSELDAGAMGFDAER
jgi:hypothetical protein